MTTTKRTALKYIGNRYTVTASSLMLLLEVVWNPVWERLLDVLLQEFQAIPGIRMRAEELGWTRPLGAVTQHFHYTDHAARIVAGLAHEPNAEIVRFLFIFAAIFEVHH